MFSVFHSCSTSQEFFYLLSDVILSIEKLKILIVSVILLFTFVLCNANFKWQYKSISLVCGIAEIIQLVLCRSYVQMCLILTRTLENTSQN